MFKTARPFGTASGVKDTPLAHATPTFNRGGFWQSAPDGIFMGSTVAGYSQTAELGLDNTLHACGKLQSISAMPVYKDKSHEVLRWEDYQLQNSSYPSGAQSSSLGNIYTSRAENSREIQTSPFNVSNQSPFGGKAPTMFKTARPFGTASFLSGGKDAPLAPDGLFMGSTVAGYSQTAELGLENSLHVCGKLQSISAMPVYKDKSHEVLRWADYQLQKSSYSSGAQSSPLVMTATLGTRGVWPSSFGNQGRGGRVAGYSSTDDIDDGNGIQPGMLKSVSAMPIYKDKTHEELRWEDSQLGAKEGAAENGSDREQTNVARTDQRLNVHYGSAIAPIFGKAGEAVLTYDHGAHIDALMPKLKLTDYYSEPNIQELAAKEKAKPGFCGHVKDFVVGRYGYGSIKFIGDTDVRGLDLGSLIHLNNREVVVYTDKSKMPSIGEGLNKPAEVTLLNIMCFDKKTGQQYTEGPKVEKYKKMLMKKTQEHGAEFISYEPSNGEWKFRVNHFFGHDQLSNGKVDLDKQVSHHC
ncbi:hypothetical protein IFM89_020147 [Coptis chinensis]|uniref:Peptidase S59 domain-containing protein n=1 Tax=Coptis chinensis TaxID=261450 RepID=A0A835H9U6_9MAGN|nr:hypothetical protein IFM89_020147 [Coptis chinensis]